MTSARNPQEDDAYAQAGVSIEAGCRNLAKLSGDDAFFAQLAECYAMERKADPVRCATLINEAREKLKRRREEV